MLKTCTKCQEMKEEDAFTTANVDGLRGECRACRSIYRKSHYLLNKARVLAQCKEYSKANAEERNAYHRAAYRADPDKRKAKIREYQVKNVDKMKRIHQIYYLKNKTTFNARARQWDRDNPERARIHSKNKCSRRRQRLKQGGGSFSVNEWIELCNRFGNRCLACGKPELTVDHVLPLSRGGTNTIDNIQPLCGSCNSRKFNQTIDYRKEMQP